jgi:hypothetical protein
MNNKEQNVDGKKKTYQSKTGKYTQAKMLNVAKIYIQ